jgi:glycosyltransferase involved in cell wall biosynthesis
MVAMLHQPPGGIDHGPVRTQLLAILDRSTYRRAARLLVASRALADELQSAGFATNRLRVVPPGRDVAPWAEGCPPDLRRGRRAAFLCVGNWVPRKGILPLLDAFGRLPPETGTLHLVGDEEADRSYSSRVRNRLAAADLVDRVVRHGPVTRQGVAAYYAAADVFVLPSWKEPYGTVYGEAMAAGLPVVGWQAGNLVHLAGNGREGVLVAPGDIAALARALKELSFDEARRSRLAAAARRRAESFPTWEQTAELFFSSLREVLDEPNPMDTIR